MSDTSNTQIEELIEKIFQILQTDFDAGQQSGNDESKIEHAPSRYSSVKIVHDAKNISIEETKLLEKAAIQREEALTKLRKNKVVEGSNDLKETEVMVAQVSLCREASLIARTYQASANGFLHLKNKNYGKAIAAMFEAIETNQELYQSFEHPVEQRRIHLGRNIAKVLYLEGKQDEAFLLALNLVKYSILDSFEWPLQSKTTEVDTIGKEKKFFVIDQLLNQIGEELVRTVPAPSSILTSLEESNLKLESNVLPEYKIVESWCRAFLSIHQNDQVQFFKNVIYFFENHKGLMPKAYSRLLQVLKITLGF